MNTFLILNLKFLDDKKNQEHIPPWHRLKTLFLPILRKQSKFSEAQLKQILKRGP